MTETIPDAGFQKENVFLQLSDDGADEMLSKRIQKFRNPKLPKLNAFLNHCDYNACVRKTSDWVSNLELVQKYNYNRETNVIGESQFPSSQGFLLFI
jgi:hypothetical protein